LILSRRKFFTGLAAGLGILAAPSIIKTPGLLMPVKAQPTLSFAPGTYWVAGEQLYAGDFITLGQDGKAFRMRADDTGPMFGAVLGRTPAGGSVDLQTSGYVWYQIGTATALGPLVTA
jgi:hypothetical protein